MPAQGLGKELLQEWVEELGKEALCQSRRVCHLIHRLSWWSRHLGGRCLAAWWWSCQAAG